MYYEHTTVREDRIQFFQVSDNPSWEEAEALGFNRADWQSANPQFLCNKRIDGDWIQAIYAKEKRCPKKGEWYLSGAFVQAWKAPNDLCAEYHIAKLVRVRRLTIVSIVATEQSDGEKLKRPIDFCDPRISFFWKCPNCQELNRTETNFHEKTKNCPYCGTRIRLTLLVQED